MTAPPITMLRRQTTVIMQVGQGLTRRPLGIKKTSIVSATASGAIQIPANVIGNTRRDATAATSQAAGNAGSHLTMLHRVFAMQADQRPDDPQENDDRQHPVAPESRMPPGKAPWLQPPPEQTRDQVTDQHHEPEQTFQRRDRPFRLIRGVMGSEHLANFMGIPAGL